MKKIAFLMLAFTASVITKAVAPNEHAGYMAAITDLKTARWILEHNPDKTAAKNEAEAIAKINEALDELKKASITDDGKDAGMDQKADETDPKVRLKKAMMWLDKANVEISKEGDTKFADGLKGKVTKDVMDARESLKYALIPAK